MKKLLPFIIIFLFSGSFLLADKKEHFLELSSSVQPAGKCQSGDCKDGNGIFIFTDGSKYEGTFSKGRFNGKGKLKYADSTNKICEGDFQGGVRHDKVICKWANGQTYEGDFKNDKPNGKGVATKSDGTKYVGEFKDGEYSKGILTTSDGSNDGEYNNGKFTGKGNITLENGNKYVGNIKDDELSNGTLTFTDGSKYEGEFKNSEYVKGVYTYSDGRVYTGEWKNNEWNGKGTLIYSDGNKFEGEFKNGKLNGKGTQTFSHCVLIPCQGAKYEGDFKDDKATGKGSLTYANGEKYEGDFKNGLLIKGSLTDKGKLIMTDNGNGTITDNRFVTEDNKFIVVWQKCSMGQNSDSECSGMATETTWNNASKYCSSLRLAGRSWRLPSYDFLRSIPVDSSMLGANSVFFPATVGSYYWTSSEWSFEGGEAWPQSWYVIDFSTVQHGEYHGDKTSSAYVRCIVVNK
jgi:hypothetical protein